MNTHSSRFSASALLIGVLTTSVIGLPLLPLAASASVSAKSVTLGSSELRLDTGSTAGSSNNPYFGGNEAADSHGHVFSAYTDKRDGGTSVYLNRSSDYGGSYQAADVRIDRASGAGTASDIGANICTDGAGSVYAVFIDTRNGAAMPFVAVSRDYGASFGTAVRLSSTTAVFELSGGGLTCDQKGDVYFSWTDNRTTVSKTDLYFQRSTDYGATWQANDTRIDSGNTVGTVDSDNLRMASDKSGRVVVAYDDARNGPRDIFIRASSDYGATFGSETKIDANTGVTDISPVIGTDQHGNFVVAWRSGNLAPLDLRASRSLDGGATWSTPVQVNTGTNIGLTGAVASGVIVDPSGVVLVTYTDERGGMLANVFNVYVNRSTDFGASFAASDKRLDLGRAEGSAATDLALPTIASDAFGNVVVAYGDERTATGDVNIFVNTSEDLGSTWQTTDTRISSGSVATRDSNDARVVLDGRARATVMYRSDRTTAGIADVYARTLTFTLVNKDLVRDGGADRYVTAGLVSSTQHPAKSVDCMVVASGQNFPDALAGTPLASWCQGPLLLVKKTSLPAATAAEIVRAWDGVDDPATDIYVLGGASAVDPAVVTAIGALGSRLDVKVVSGATRIGTALGVAAELDTLRGTGPGAAWITRSDAFPDALVLGAAAGSRSVDVSLEPVLLTPSGSLDSNVAAYLASKTATLKKAFVAGGTSAVSPTVFNDVDTIIDTVTRYGGANRWDTGKMINIGFFGGARTPLGLTLASGSVFADPLSGGPNAAAFDRPVVLTQKDNLPTESSAYVTSVAATAAGGLVLGGTVAVSDAVKNYVQSLY